jgi:hypothetical protein
MALGREAVRPSRRAPKPIRHFAIAIAGELCDPRGQLSPIWLPGKPGGSLALTWRHATFAPGQSTQLDARFEAVGDETRVTVKHRGWDEIPQDHVARHGFELMLFQRRQAEHWRGLLASFGAKLRRHRE